MKHPEDDHVDGTLPHTPDAADMAANANSTDSLIADQQIPTPAVSRSTFVPVQEKVATTASAGEETSVDGDGWNESAPADVAAPTGWDEADGSAESPSDPTSEDVPNNQAEDVSVRPEESADRSVPASAGVFSDPTPAAADTQEVSASFASEESNAQDAGAYGDEHAVERSDEHAEHVHESIDEGQFSQIGHADTGASDSAEAPSDSHAPQDAVSLHEPGTEGYGDQGETGSEPIASLEHNTDSSPSYAEQSGTEQPETEPSAAQKPPAEQWAAEQSAAEQSEVEQPQAEQPVAQQQATEQPQSERPDAEQPQSEPLVTEQPQSEQPDAEQPEQPEAETAQPDQPATETPYASTSEPVDAEASASDSGAPESVDATGSDTTTADAERPETLAPDGLAPEAPAAEAAAPGSITPDDLSLNAAAAAAPEAAPSSFDDSTPLARELAEITRRRHAIEAESLPLPSAPRIFTVANQKGGVGKTTTTVNLAAALARAGARVLVIDLDPQGNASTALGVEHRSDTVSVYDVIVNDEPMSGVVQKSPEFEALYCVPATIHLAGAEIELVSMVAREQRLHTALDRFLGEAEKPFHYVFIDCPPSLGLLTINAFVAAREVLIPIQCEYYALEGLSQLLSNIKLIERHLNPKLAVSTILLTMYDGRTNLANQVAEDVREHFPNEVLATLIPRSVRISEAPSYGQSVISYDPTSPGSLSYLEAASEIARRGAPE